MEKIVIAIDGYSSCGKSTFAKKIAKKLDYIFIDTGAMYRAATLFAIENDCIDGKKLNNSKLESLISNIKIDFQYNKEKKESYVCLNGTVVENKIRGIEVSNLVSVVSQNQKIREMLVTSQQLMGNNKGIVMDGRDIGTTVFPNAELKIFMTASVEIRAKRRFDELSAKGENLSYDEIAKNVADRDYQDENREISPLRRADDAILLDNSNISIEEQMIWVTEIINNIISKKHD